MGGQGRCEQRSEVFVKNKKKCRGVQVGGGGGGLDVGLRVDVNEELKFLQPHPPPHTHILSWGGQGGCGCE